MLLSLDNLRDGSYKDLFGKTNKGYRFVYEEKPVLNEHGDVLLDDDGEELYELIKTKIDLEFEDNLMFIEGDGTFEHRFETVEGEETSVNYINDAFLVKYKSNEEDCYYVAFNRPRVKNNTIIYGTSIDNYITSKTCESWDNNKKILMAKSRFNSNINLSSEEFGSMDDFINAEKDITLSYIVGNKYEVYYDGSSEDSTDFSTDDYNDWFVRVMRNENGAFMLDGDFVMGYMLSDFINNKDEIESAVDNIDNRIDIYSK